MTESEVRQRGCGRYTQIGRYIHSRKTQCRLYLISLLCIIIVSTNLHSQSQLMHMSYLLPFSLGPEKRQRYVDMAKEYNDKATSLLWTTI